MHRFGLGGAAADDIASSHQKSRHARHSRLTGIGKSNRSERRWRLTEISFVQSVGRFFVWTSGVVRAKAL